MRSASLLSNIVSTLFFSALVAFVFLLRIPLWALRPRDLMSPGPEHALHEVALGYGIAIPVSGFFYVLPLTILFSWIFFLRRRYTAALITGWLPLLNILLPPLILIVTLVLMNVM